MRTESAGWRTGTTVPTQKQRKGVSRVLDLPVVAGLDLSHSRTSAKSSSILVQAASRKALNYHPLFLVIVLFSLFVSLPSHVSAYAVMVPQLLAGQQPSFFFSPCSRRHESVKRRLSSSSSALEETESNSGSQQLPFFATPVEAKASSNFNKKESPSEDRKKNYSNNEILQQVFSNSRGTQNNSQPILLFDGVCNFCNGGVNFCLDHDSRAIFRYASLQSEVGKSLLVHFGKDPDDLSSIVLVVSPEKAYFQSEAVLRVAEQLDGLPAFVRVLAKLSRQVAPSFVRDSVYHFIGMNRYRIGNLLSLESSEGPQCRLDFMFDETGTIQSRFVEDPVPTNTAKR